MFNREEWFEKDCMTLTSEEIESCKVCPYVVCDNEGTLKCDIQQYVLCENITSRDPIGVIALADNDHSHDYRLELVKNNINYINEEFKRIGYIYLYDIFRIFGTSWDPHNDNPVFIKDENEYEMELKDKGTCVIVYIYNKNS